MTRYFRVMLGRSSSFADECLREGFVGVDFELNVDLSGQLTDSWKEFNKKFIPVYLGGHPEKTKIAAGLACGMTWTLAKGMQLGDMVVSPMGNGTYRFGEIAGDYRFVKGSPLFHQRKVTWFETTFSKDQVSDVLRKAMGYTGTICDISGYSEELDKLRSGLESSTDLGSDPSVEEPSVFVLEKYLEEFLVSNWANTELGKDYLIYEDENGTGQQFQTDSGRIDILAISKDQKELLVVELKKGRASDVVVGQITRYMGYVTTELAAAGQKVRGVIVALEDDQKLRHSLVIVPGVDFYRYEVSFKLRKI